VLTERSLLIGAAAAAILWSCTVSISRAPAGEFDLLRTKRSAKATARGQSPTIEPAGMTTETPPAYSEGIPTGWGYDSSPCFNCGECDHHIRCTQRNRRCCGQTWYPRLAPYCQADWGWTQPCWRRMADNYNCPPVQGPTLKGPRTPAPEPAVQPLPGVPEPPPATSRAQFPYAQ